MTPERGTSPRLMRYPPGGRGGRIAALIAIAIGASAAAPGFPAQQAPAASTAAGRIVTAGSATSPPAGFAADDQTLFAPIVQLAPPGPARAARAVAIFDRQLVFQRKILFHPEIDAALKQVIDQVPLGPSTAIRSAALYTSRTIPWSNQPDGTHQISVGGGPSAINYLYRLTDHYRSPETSDCLSGRWALQPASGSTPATAPTSVIGMLGGELLTDMYDLGALVDVVAAALTECYGDPHPPWDTVPGAFNQHDRALLNRLHHGMPHFASKLDEYLRVHNVIDEFQSPAGPIVLYNLDVEARLDALQRYPRLADFYRRVVASVTAQFAVHDVEGNDWLRTGIDRGHIRVIFMVHGGRLTPFNASMQPGGDGVALNEIERGSYRTLAAVRVSSLQMNFGLANIGFTTTYRRTRNAVVFETKMNTVPELVAPPGIRQVIDLVAGTFLQVLATGHGGPSVRLSSRRLPSGMYHFAGSARAEFYYAPPLAFLARIADAFANEHDAAVRAEERAFGEELFDALVADYADARAAILAMGDRQER